MFVPTADTPNRVVFPITFKALSRIFYYHKQPIGSYQIIQREASKRILVFRPDKIVDEGHQLYELLFDFLPTLTVNSGFFIIEIGLSENPYTILNAIAWVVSRGGDLVHQVQRLQKEVDLLKAQLAEMEKDE